MRDFLGGIAIMVGIGYFGWGVLFLLKHPQHGEGETALILGLSTVLVGIFLLFPSPHDTD